MSATTELRDIETHEDCERLVRAFYGRTLTDPMIGYIFTDIAKLDLEAHVPVIASFWETVLLGSKTYSGGAFAPHAMLHQKVPLRAPHFERWLMLWRITIDELFAGENAELAKSHARRVATAFFRRLQGVPSAVEQLPPPPTGLPLTMHGRRPDDPEYLD
jgi:hemoglobin